MEKRKAVPMAQYFIHLLFVLYFIILFAERAQSLVRSVNDPAVKLFGDGFNRYTYSITLLSLAAFLVYLLLTNRSIWVGVFTTNAAVHESVNMGALCIASGILLVSGMVHTEYTIAPLQFGAYGALIAAMIIQTALNQAQSEKPALLWLSIAFLTAFSMAIPVMYRSNIDHAALFHLLEAVTALVLVAGFTFMLYKVFCGDATDLFYLSITLAAVILDAALIIMRRQEEMNWFVLIALGATVVLFAAGIIVRQALK